VRSRAQLQKVVKANPFARKAKEAGHLHLVFLAAKPAAAKVKALTAADWGDDQVAVQGTEAYLHLPNDYGRAKLNNMIVEKKLGDPVPESNLASELNTSAPQPAQRYTPSSWTSHSSPVKACSVPASRSTRY